MRAPAIAASSAVRRISSSAWDSSYDKCRLTPIKSRIALAKSRFDGNCTPSTAVSLVSKPGKTPTTTTPSEMTSQRIAYFSRIRRVSSSQKMSANSMTASPTPRTTIMRPPRRVECARGAS